MGEPRRNSQGLEDNTLAILDSSGIREARDVHDDRLSFLEAVRAASLASVSPCPPSWKMFDAILQILRNGKSLELAMASFQLLNDLEKRYPRAYWKEPNDMGTNSGGDGELVVNKEAWSPFAVGLENSYVEASGLYSKNLFDSMTLSMLMAEIAIDAQPAIKIVEKLLLLQYLVSVLEADFLPRHASYKKSSDWVSLRESMLSILMASRKMNYKNFVRCCLSIISNSFSHETNICLNDLNADLPQSCNAGLSLAFPEIQRKTCDAVQKLLILILEFDVIRKEAETFGLTSRSDGFRVPVLETILDELTYNKDQISPFLEVFGEPRWKLEIILLYFGKYYSRPSARIKRSNDLPSNDTFEGILNCFSTPTTSRGIVRKVTSEVAQLLLAHAFQSYLSLIHDQRYTNFVTEMIGGSTLLQICKSLISAFRNLKKVDDCSLLAVREWVPVQPFVKTKKRHSDELNQFFRDLLLHLPRLLLRGCLAAEHQILHSYILLFGSL